MMNFKPAKISAFLRRQSQMEVLPLVTIMVLVLVLMMAHLTWAIAVPIKALVIAGLLFKRVRTDPRMWCVLTALLAVALYVDWHPRDNHQYLIIYLSLMLFCIFHISREHRDQVLATSGRLLIGAVMVFAVIWKAITPDYLSGDFFHHGLLTHPHLQNIAAVFTDVCADVLAENSQIVALFDLNYLTTTPEDSVAIEGSPQIGTMAFVMTWWTIAIEAIIALLFLWPRRFGGGHSVVFYGRHLALALFIATTYPPAPIIGFGWALVILGLADCADRPTVLRPLYVALFFFLLFAGFLTVF